MCAEAPHGGVSAVWYDGGVARAALRTGRVEFFRSPTGGSAVRGGVTHSSRRPRRRGRARGASRYVRAGRRERRCHWTWPGQRALWGVDSSEPNRRASRASSRCGRWAAGADSSEPNHRTSPATSARGRWAAAWWSQCDGRRMWSRSVPWSQRDNRRMWSRSVSGQWGRCLRPVVGAWRPAHLGRRRRSCGGVRIDSFIHSFSR